MSFMKNTQFNIVSTFGRIARKEVLSTQPTG